MGLYIHTYMCMGPSVLSCEHKDKKWIKVQLFKSVDYRCIYLTNAYNYSIWLNGYPNRIYLNIWSDMRSYLVNICSSSSLAFTCVGACLMIIIQHTIRDPVCLPTFPLKVCYIESHGAMLQVPVSTLLEKLAVKSKDEMVNPSYSVKWALSNCTM